MTEDVTVGTLADYNARALAFRNGTWDHDVSQNIDALLAAIDRTPATILDLGCGPGRDLIAFTHRGHRVIGLDGAEEFVKLACAVSGCEVWQQNLLSLALPPEGFDGIFANAVMQHVPIAHLSRVLGELHAALKPGGALMCSIPHGDNRAGWNNGRYSVYHLPENWFMHLADAGFVELRHYYRPAGRPREQQPWLAGVWRKAARAR